MLAGLARHRAGPILAVTATEAEAQQMRSELRFFGGEGESAIELLALPDWDVTPYKGYSPSAEVQRARMGSLHHLALGGPGICVAPIAALRKRVLKPAALLGLCETLTVGDVIDRDALLIRLAARGFLATDQCSEPGSFAVRGGILDIFSPGMSGPLRLEFWGDEIESIRRFDPWTQRSIESLTEAHLLPVREEFVSPEAIERLPERLKQLTDSRGVRPRVRIELQRDLAEGRILQEQELFLPLLQPEMSNVFDYLGPEGLLVWSGSEAIADQLIGSDDSTHAGWVQAGGRERLLPDPEDLFIPEAELLDLAGGCRRLILPELHDGEVALEETLHFDAPDHSELRAELLASEDSPEGMLEPLVRRIRRWHSTGCDLRVVGRTRQGEQLAELLRPYDIAVAFERGELHRGFRLESERTVVLAADEILGSSKPRSKAGRRPAGHEAIGSLAQLMRGDLVVHSIHGIGRFCGLTKLRLDAGGVELATEAKARANDPSYLPGSGGRLGGSGGSNNDYLLVLYRDDDRLYLPVHKLNFLARYVAAGGPTPRLDKLGGQTWSKRRKKVSEDVQRIARELLDLYAKRQLARSQPYAAPDAYYDEFCASFAFEETPDQHEAIAAVLQDMTSPQPMDRLVCGDVGFGKTEVAMRASFVAVSEGRQVALLVPTTILALQHYEVFKERMEPFGIRIAMMSRFRTAAQQRVIGEALEAGRVDIVVGTHRLLSRDIKFKDLGLLVVDEEHRFGVTHKERIKTMRTGIDVLTLTATPIPRTLHMALAGIRDFSVIATAPVGRRPVRTSVARFGNQRILDAIAAERARGGQIFFVHNRVKTIYRMADYLQKRMPDLTIRVAHGQMNERELEEIMLDFFQRRFDLLLATTIIESGIDVPSANTMIINRADHLGLAQLHQLRGRVGRSLEQGFCLLLVPPGRALRGVALKRLRAIQDNSDLGAGHRIAQQDLELRGAGNLLGSKQAGHIAGVGLVTYLELLESAVAKLQGKDVATGPEPNVDLRAEAWIPGDYIADERDRLLTYKRLCDAPDRDALADLFADLEDRYGHPPVQVLAFERLIEVKVRCRELRVLSLRMARGGRMEFTFDATSPLDGGALLEWVTADSRKLSFKPEGLLLVSLGTEERKAPVEAAIALLERLTQFGVRAEPAGQPAAP
jgi:transcription-repair coupling factor (superfamily II helicase)